MEPSEHTPDKPSPNGEDTNYIFEQIEALKSRDIGTRQRAARMLCDLADARAALPLVEALKDTDEEVHLFAAEALVNIGAPSVLLLANMLKDMRWITRYGFDEEGQSHFNITVIVMILGRIGEPAVPSLMEMLTEGYVVVRRNVAEVLGEIGDPSALPLLQVALKDRDETVRRKAAEALKKMGDSRALPYLQEALKDRDEYVRQYAIEALGKMRGDAVLQNLIKALSAKDWRVRMGAVRALGEIGDACAVLPLAERLKDTDTEVRSEAIEALGKLGEPAVLPLIAVLQNEDGNMEWYIRRSAAAVLGRIGDARAVLPLLEALQDEDEGVRERAMKALRNLRVADRLPVKVVAEERLTLTTRLHILETLIRRKLSPIRSVSSYCQRLLERTDLDVTVKEAARSLLMEAQRRSDQGTLLRSSEREESREQEELLRASQTDENRISSQELLRASNDSTEKEPHKQGLLRRLFRRE